MNKNHLLFFLMLLFAFNVGVAQEAPDLEDAKRLLQTWLEAQKDYEQLPGIAVAVVNDQDLLWKEGFGLADVEQKNTTQTNTIYSICSISKLFTAISIMQLRDAGKLSLEDEVSKHLSWFTIKQKYEDSGPITIRSLLTHSAGLPRQSNFPYWREPFDFPTIEQIKAQIDGMETLYPASTYFQYSNFGMSILGAVIEEVSGESFNEYVEKNILEVLDLKDTRPYMPKELLKGQLATGYSALDRSGDRREVDLFFTDGVTAAAGFTSTVEDLAKFASWQFRLLENGGEEILRSSTLKEMQRVHWMDPDWELAWGLGFTVRQHDGETVVGHGGSCPGYRTQLSLTPKKKLAFVVMVNASGVNTGKYLYGMSDVIGKALDAEMAEIPEGLNLEDYAGTYNAQPWGSETVILPWYGDLAVMGLPSNNPSSFGILKHVEGDTFRRKRDDGELGETVVFERDDDGKVIKMWQHQNYSLKMK
jgi:CubicO group peptidase (beta-lactamase class C family)